MSFGDTSTSPPLSDASDRLRPPSCVLVRAHGVEGTPALNSQR